MATVAATGTGSQSGREARRRRILERGSDRLALITGKIQSLPPVSEQSAPQTSLTRQTSYDSPQPEDNLVFGSTTLDQESHKEPSLRGTVTEIEEPSPLNNDDGKSTLSHDAGETLVTLNSDKGRDPSSREIEETPKLDGIERKDITSRAAALLGIEKEFSQISSTLRSPPQDNQRARSIRSPHTTARIRTAIAATENTRICTAVAAAILVILSLTRFPILGSPGVQKVLLLRPCYLLLLTNISIVLARLITLNATDSRTRQTSRGSAVGVGKAIEVGLTLQSILAALTMDFGIYAILLICGHPLIQRFGR